MPGPGIASATISVDLDGKRIPAEAAALGREAGLAMGRAHSDAYEGQLNDGLSATGRRLARDLKNQGDEDGKLFGQSFTKSMEGEIQSRARVLQKDLAGIFVDKNGFNDFNKELNGSEAEIGNVDRAVKALTIKFKELFDAGGVDKSSFREGTKALDQWAVSAREVEKAAVRDRNAIDDLHGEALKLLDTFNSDAAKKFADDIYNDASGSREFRTEMKSLTREAEQFTRQLDTSDRTIATFGEELRKAKVAAELASPEMRRLQERADDLNAHVDDVRLTNWVNDLTRIAQPANAAERELGKLLLVQRDSFDSLRVGAKSYTDFDNGLRDVEPRLHALSQELGVSHLALGEVISGFRDVGAVFSGLGGGVEKAAGAFDGLSVGADRAGKSVGGLGGVFSQLSAGLTGGGGALGIAAILALIIAALGPLSVLASAAAAGLVILGGAALGAIAGLGGLFIGLSGLLKPLKDIPSAARPAATALQDLIGGFTASKSGQLTFTVGKIKELQTTLEKHITVGLAPYITSLTNNLLPALNTGFGVVGDALNTFLKSLTKDITTPEALKEINAIFVGLKPLITDLGTTVGLTGAIIGKVFLDVQPYVKKFLDDTNTALSGFLKFLDSPKGHDAIQKWFGDSIEVLGKVGDLIGSLVTAISGLAANPENVTNTVRALQDLADSAPGLAKLGDELSAVTPEVTGAFAAITEAGAGAANAFDPLLSGAEAAFFAITGTLKFLALAIHDTMAGVVTTVIDAAQVLADVASGNILKAGQDAQKMAKDYADATVKVQNDLKALAGDGEAMLSRFSGSAQKAALAITTSLGLTGHAAKDAAGHLAEMASEAGVSLSKLARDNSWKQIATDLGLTGSEAQAFVATWSDAIGGRAVKSVKDLNTEGKRDLAALASNLGLTGKGAQAFENLVAVSSKGSKSALNGLAKDQSLAQVERALGLTGSRARAFEAAFVASMGDAGSSADTTKGKVNNLHSSVTTLPDGKHLRFDEVGAEAAAAQVAALASQVRALRDRSITISVNAQVNSKYAQGLLGNRYGGIMAGGQQIAGGEMVAFANGGILNTPTVFGNVLAGEAGAEAIVPLTGPLSKVDASVRQLSAFARGMSDGFGGPTKVIYVQPNITVPTSDPIAAAGYVVDRLVPQL